MGQLLWTSLGAFAGAILSLIAYIAYEHTLLLRRPSAFFGKWKATWQPTIDQGWEWLTEELLIERRFGKIFLRNLGNSRGYSWQGKAKIIDDKFLVGEWKSVKPGSHSKGAFTLAVGFEGNYMVGFFFGPDTASSKIISGFILGRTHEDVEEGKRRLEKSRIVFPRKDVRVP